MQAVTGIFKSQTQADQVVRTIRSSGIHTDRVTLLTPGGTIEEKVKSVAVDTTEQPGIAKAIGGVVGGAAGLSGGLVAAVVPGVGPVTAIGLLGAAVLAAAGGTFGAMAGASLENFTTQGLPEDEIFVYEDALRKGRSVVIALVDADDVQALRDLLKAQGAEAVDAAREQWWGGLRSAEREHYKKAGRDFAQDEGFFRLGFEAALHARHRCQEFDQVSAEMDSALEDLHQRFPGVDLEGPFVHGYQRGREYYQRVCDDSKAA